MSRIGRPAPPVERSRSPRHGSGDGPASSAAAPPTQPPPARPPGPKSGRRNGTEPLRAALLSGPALIAAAALILFPIGYAVVLSFSKWSDSNGLSGTTLANYITMLHDGLFWHALLVTAQMYFVGIAAQTILGIGLGYLLSRDVPGHRVMQALIIIPSLTAPAAIGLSWLLMYDPSLGVVNYILHAVGIHGINWLADPQVVVWSLIIVETWQWTPFMGLIISAGIRALPKEPFEAAAVDGASGIQSAFRVGLPLLRPVIMVAVLLRSVDLIRYFDTGYIMTQGGPVNASTTLNIYGYRKGFEQFDLSYASALQVTLLVLVVIAALGLTWLRRRSVIDA